MNDRHTYTQTHKSCTLQAHTHSHLTSNEPTHQPSIHPSTKRRPTGRQTSKQSNSIQTIKHTTLCLSRNPTTPIVKHTYTRTHSIYGTNVCMHEWSYLTVLLPYSLFRGVIIVVEGGNWGKRAMKIPKPTMTMSATAASLICVYVYFCVGC